MAKFKKEIIIAVVLVFCLLMGTAVMFFVEKKVGTPLFYNGEMQNIKVTITEICSSNGSIIANDDGDFPDYIELYNEGDSFNLADFGLVTEVGNGKAYTFGDIEFKSGTYLVVYLDGINVPFRLNSDGNEYIALIAWDGTVIDSATTLSTRSNQVMLRTNDGFTVSDEASPGYPNTKEGLEAFRSGDEGAELSLVINEILTSNGSVLPDFQGEFCDIIEIKNISAAAVSTKGYFISDSLDNRLRCALPEKTLAPGEIMLVFASGKETVSENGEFHADFRISADETAVLSYGSKFVTQKIEICANNCSQSRTVGENGVEFVQMAATPGFENDENGLESLENSRIFTNSPLVISEILLSADGTPYGGKLRDVIEICNISSESVSTSGWYVSDSDEDPYRFALPEKTLEPNECLVLYAEKGVGENVCNFALSSGESVYLTAPDFKRSEMVSCADAGTGLSKNLIFENGEAVYVNGEISIGFANGENGILDYAAAVRPVEVEISEVVTMNRSYVPGPYKTFHDLAELHNTTDRDINLSGWYLSDDAKEPVKASLNGVVIPAGGYVIITLSSDGVNVPLEYHSVDFSLSSSGETLCLSKGETIVDAVVIPSMGIDTSYGRAKGEDGFSVLASPTPEAENTARATEKAAMPEASIPQGVYDETEILVELSGEGDIYYTLDCTKPTASSTRYTKPFTLNSTTVIRCITVAQGKKTSDIQNLTYIVNEPDTLETVSVVTEPDNLFDHYTGIYATGPNAEAEFPYNWANYYMRWEREANISFFADNDEGFSENCGVRIFGGLSRALDKKSLAFFFRSSYGAGELNYQLFEDSELDVYEAFVLRNMGQDWKLSAMRDAMITSIASDYLDMDVQNCRPVVVYINGEYWGIYFIREKLNENYVAAHYNVDPSEAEVAFANGNDSENYKSMVAYAASHDLSVQEHYDHIASLVDIDNYIDYIVAEIIIGNTDNGNIRFFNYEGGKWRWMMYDTDHGFRSYTWNTVASHLNPGGTGAGNMFSTKLINSLLKNPQFKKMFLEEIAYQLNNVWTPEVVHPYIDEFAGMVAGDIQRDCVRWSHSYDTWVSSVESLHTFIDVREGYIIDYVKDYFSLSDSEMREYGFDI